MQRLKQAVPQTNEFVLDDENMTHIGTSTKKGKSKKAVGKLKKHKPKKRWSKRVGRKAAMEKVYYTRKGIHELSQSTECKYSPIYVIWFTDSKIFGDHFSSFRID